MIHDNPALLRADAPGRSLAKSPAVALPVVVLPETQPLTIVAASGQPLLQIVSTAHGPTIRLVQDHLRIETSGQLEMAARSIRFEASEDVRLQGRTIRLN
jgi:hypothetical protein